MDVKTRFLNYVSFWTTSDENSDASPSTERQFALAKVLKEELLSLGLAQVELDEHCYVYGLLPATEGHEDCRPMGLIAHMDTSPDVCGEHVKPQVIENYDGKDIELPAANVKITVKDFPRLPSLKGGTLITTDGTTLLGADDKAGIAEIMTALEEIIGQKIPHGDLWVAFTPDEEVGRGADHFNLDKFKAEYAYTVDGGFEGEISYENFNAASADFYITGKNVHPGDAKNVMVNAAAIACEIQSLLPKYQMPEHTEGREGFYHLTRISGDVGNARLSYIVRDHDAALFKNKTEYLGTLERFFNIKYGSGTVRLEIKESYRNMLEVVEKNMEIVDLAKKAIISVGLTPVSDPVRGGTDGSKLSFRGLPCPNLGTGGYGFHGPMEHIAAESMEKVVSILCYIASHPI